MKSRHLVIRTEAEAQRDHAATWLWGFFFGAAFTGCVVFITYWVIK